MELSLVDDKRPSMATGLLDTPGPTEVTVILVTLHQCCISVVLLVPFKKYIGATMILVTLHQHCTSVVPNLYYLKNCSP